MATSLIVGGSDTFGGAASERYYNNFVAFPSFPSSKNLVPINIDSGTTKNYLSMSIELKSFFIQRNCTSKSLFFCYNCYITIIL